MTLGFCHEKSIRGESNEWYTPPSIVNALGEFDLDPCSPSTDHWTADRCLTLKDDGLSCEWFGRVWLNPPYGPEVAQWLSRLAGHGHGTALVFARTETTWFFSEVWEKATALRFMKGRVSFISGSGVVGTRASAPSVLVAYGNEDAKCLESCKIPGAFVPLRSGEKS